MSSVITAKYCASSAAKTSVQLQFVVADSFCQYQWLPPAWPAWNAIPSAFDKETILLSVIRPPRTDGQGTGLIWWENDPWGKKRRDIGFVYDDPTPKEYYVYFAQEGIRHAGTQIDPLSIDDFMFTLRGASAVNNYYLKGVLAIPGHINMKELEAGVFDKWPNERDPYRINLFDDSFGTLSYLRGVWKNGVIKSEGLALLATQFLDCIIDAKMVMACDETVTTLYFKGCTVLQDIYATWPPSELFDVQDITATDTVFLGRFHWEPPP